MKVLQDSPHYVRGLFYSLTVVLGLVIALTELDSGNFQTFWTMTFLVAAIFVIELYSGWDYRRRYGRKLVPGEEYDTASQFIHHLLLPISMYAATVVFGYYNNEPGVRLGMLLVVFLILTLLFTRIRAFYQQQQKVLAHTHYVYDLSKILIFFFAADAEINYARGFGVAAFANGVFVAFLAFTFIFLNALRHRHLNVRAILLIAGLSMVGGMVVWLLSLSSLNPLQLSVAAVIGYYLITATIYHWFNRDLTPGLISEYLLVATSIVVVLLALNS